MPPTIMIDGYNLAMVKGTGIATYARTLSLAAHALGYRTEILYGRADLKAKDDLQREIAFFDPKPRPPGVWNEIVHQAGLARDVVRTPFGLTATRFTLPGKVVDTPFAGRMPYFDALWNAPRLYDLATVQFHLTGRFTAVRGVPPPDIMHWTYPLPIRVPGARNIYTLHDLVPLKLPYTTLDHKKRYQRLAARLARDADHIVTVSETSRRDIIDLTGIAPERVTNAGQSVEIPADLAGKPEDEARREAEQIFGLPWRGYFLFFGSIEPKKNVGRLIEGHLAAATQMPLVLVGGRAWKAEEETALLGPLAGTSPDSPAVRSAYGGRLRKIDYVPFRLLVSLIRGARAVTFPSIYEGFGLPIAEAMSLGTPVLTSKGGAMEEIAGDAALLVDPYDPRDIGRGLERLEHDDRLCADLAARGRLRAAHYSRERYCERLGALYAALLRQPARA